MPEHPAHPSGSTPWSTAWTVLKWGKWALAAFAINQVGALIDTLFFAAIGVLVVAVVVDRLRTRRLLRQWDAHCEDIAEQWVRNQTTPPTTTAITAALPDSNPSRWAA